VTFYFDWTVLGHAEGPGGAVQQLQNEVVSLAIGSTPFPVSLPQETWLEILHQVRYRDVAIVEIPLIEDERNPLARAHEHLETARERFQRADDRGVLVACGEALDVLAYARQVKLSKEYGFEHLVQDLIAPIFDSSRKAERLGRLFTGLRQMCLSGKHDEPTPEGRPIPVDHNDAMLAFLMTSAALSYLEQLPLEQSLSAGRGGVAGRPRRRRPPRQRAAGGDGAQPAATTPEPEAPAPEPAAAPLASAPRRRRRRRAPRSAEPAPDQPAS